MRRLGRIGVAVGWCAGRSPSHGQTLEASLFIGYRFGGGFFERVTGQAVDLDGARAVGAGGRCPPVAMLAVRRGVRHPSGCTRRTVALGRPRRQ